MRRQYDDRQDEQHVFDWLELICLPILIHCVKTEESYMHSSTNQTLSCQVSNSHIKLSNGRSLISSRISSTLITINSLYTFKICAQRRLCIHIPPIATFYSLVLCPIVQRSRTYAIHPSCSSTSANIFTPQHKKGSNPPFMIYLSYINSSHTRIVKQTKSDFSK